MDEGAEEDAGGRTAAETGPAKSSAHVQWRLRLLQESDADYVLCTTHLSVPDPARSDFRRNFDHFSKRCASSYPHYLEFPDDWFAVPREGHNARPRPLYLEVSQEW